MTTNDNCLTIGDFLTWATTSLAKADIPTARLDSLILLEDIVGESRAHLLAHLELPLSKNQKETLEKLVEQRTRHIPLAYLRGRVMFYGRSFYVNQSTLIPRPESEDTITILKERLPIGSKFLIADIGTGSGCLGLTAALELRNCRVDLYDIDSNALEVARKNAQHLGVQARYFEEDLLSRAKHRRYDALVANLPYVPDDYIINVDATFEPKIALFAGTDGLDMYRSFWEQVIEFTTKPMYILTESLPDTQHRQLISLADRAGYTLRESRDFIQLFSLTSQ
jgi:release factor glutamine methyltransferase